MWFFRSVEYLVRPSLEYLASNISVLVIWFAFQGMSFSILGLEITPFGLTIGVFLTLNFSRSTPQRLSEIHTKQDRRQHLWIVAFVWAGLMAAVLLLSDFALQLLVLGSYLTMLVLLLIMSVAAPEMIARLPFRWRADPEERAFVFTAVRILILRDAVFCAVAMFVLNHGDLTDWVILIVLGRMFFYYLFDWITVVFWLTEAD